jgi:D-sedoheptulose 7-phosphate isomerase
VGINNVYKNFFELISKNVEAVDYELINYSVELILKAHKNRGKIIIAGNGGSAAMASHVSVDFIKAVNIRAINFNEADLITCFANDYGYENWIACALKAYADPKDVVILISSSGKSPNILNAALTAKEMGLETITFSGFSSNNHLKDLGAINFWVDSNSYNVVEMTHHIWLLGIVEQLIAVKAEIL